MCACTEAFTSNPHIHSLHPILRMYPLQSGRDDERTGRSNGHFFLASNIANQIHRKINSSPPPRFFWFVPWSRNHHCANVISYLSYQEWLLFIHPFIITSTALSHSFIHSFNPLHILHHEHYATLPCTHLPRSFLSVVCSMLRWRGGWLLTTKDENPSVWAIDFYPFPFRFILL